VLAGELPVGLRTHSALLQALVKILDDISNDEIRSLEIPTGVPLIYELNDDLKPVRHYHVGYATIPLPNAHEHDCMNPSMNMTVNMNKESNEFEYDMYGQHDSSV
jgi:hypothetical protein